MENKKQISIRLEPEIIRAAEKAVERHNYWKRSDFINRILLAVIYNFSDQQIYDMIRWSPWDRKRVNCQFEETDEDLPYEEHMARRKMWEKK